MKVEEMEITMEYSKIVVPKGMRSSYWRYFGFPADEDDHIVTKNKIVCALCSNSIVYNKNTTNLRTHLVAKHPDEFINLTQEKKRESATISDLGTENYIAPKKLKLVDNMTQITKDMNQKQTVGIKMSEELVTFQSIDNDEAATTTEVEEYHEEDPSAYDFVGIEESNNSAIINTNQPSIDVNDLIKKMIITDLMSPTDIKGVGFKNFVRCLGGDFNELKQREIEQNIQMTYEENFNEKVKDMAQQSNNGPFSFTVEFFENYQNFEPNICMSICFTYLDKSNFSLENIFYKIVPLYEYINFDEIFFGFNLKNCLAFVLSQRHDQLEQYIKENVPNVQVILCLDAVLQNCIKAVFQLIDVNEIFEEVSKLHHKTYRLYDLSSIPEVDDICVWSKFNIFRYFTGNIDLKNDCNNLMEKTNEILECLNPLKITLDTIADEPIPSCSLIQPLISKLIDQNYCIEERDSEMTKQIKIIINKELSESILDNPFLVEAAFVDPRFQHFIGEDSSSLVKSHFMSKYASSVDIKEEYIKQDSVRKNVVATSSSSSRKSSLKMFFNQSEEKSKPTQLNKNSLEVELDKYLNESSVDLDQCPVAWWLDIGLSYKNLKNIAINYFCVPCSVNNLFKQSVDKRIDIYNRRRQLKDKYLNQLWFLHINNCTEKYSDNVVTL